MPARPSIMEMKARHDSTDSSVTTGPVARARHRPEFDTVTCSEPVSDSPPERDWLSGWNMAERGNTAAGQSIASPAISHASCSYR